MRRRSRIKADLGGAAASAVASGAFFAAEHPLLFSVFAGASGAFLVAVVAGWGRLRKRKRRKRRRYRL